MQTIFGAIASQEVIKAATGLHMPMHQCFVHDVIDDFIAILPSSSSSNKEESLTKEESDVQWNQTASRTLFYVKSFLPRQSPFSPLHKQRLSM